jgi:hypothetical protein
VGVLFKDDLLDRFGTWALGYSPYGGADFGEIQAVADGHFSFSLSVSALAGHMGMILSLARAIARRAFGEGGSAYHGLNSPASCSPRPRALTDPRRPAHAEATPYRWRGAMATCAAAHSACLGVPE